MTTWTVDQIMDERPCRDYPRERIEALAGSRKRMTTLEIMRREDISADDRMWLALRPRAMTEKQHAIVIEHIVARCVTNHALHCGVKVVERWAQRWLSGEDRSVEAARAAARATRAAVGEAAWATRAAAVEAARAAAWEARAAARATRAAAEEARAEERKLQVADVIAVLGGGK